MRRQTHKNTDSGFPFVPSCLRARYFPRSIVPGFSLSTWPLFLLSTPAKRASPILDTAFPHFGQSLTTEASRSRGTNPRVSKAQRNLSFLSTKEHKKSIIQRIIAFNVIIHGILFFLCARALICVICGSLRGFRNQLSVTF